MRVPAVVASVSSICFDLLQMNDGCVGLSNAEIEGIVESAAIWVSNADLIK